MLIHFRMQITKEMKQYNTPSLNDKMYLHFKVCCVKSHKTPSRSNRNLSFAVHLFTVLARTSLPKYSIFFRSTHTHRL